VRSLTHEAGRNGHLDAECADAARAAVGQRAASSPGAAARLTEREVEVLRLIARGQTNKEIARSLGISDRTVQHHSIHIYEKLGVNTRAAATLLAVRSGLV
jgi:DNA-binding NarL/FixJ family response regulator